MYARCLHPPELVCFSVIILASVSCLKAVPLSFLNASFAVIVNGLFTVHVLEPLVGLNVNVGAVTSPLSSVDPDAVV